MQVTSTRSCVQQPLCLAHAQGTALLNQRYNILNLWVLIKGKRETCGHTGNWSTAITCRLPNGTAFNVMLCCRLMSYTVISINQRSYNYCLIHHRNLGRQEARVLTAYVRLLHNAIDHVSSLVLAFSIVRCTQKQSTIIVNIIVLAFVKARLIGTKWYMKVNDGKR